MPSQIEVLDLDAIGVPEDTGERVTLFHLNNKDYTIPKAPRPNLALKFLWQRKTVGEMEAASNLLGEMLGEEAFMALMEWEGLTSEILEKVCNAAAMTAMGQMENALGNSGGGQSK